MKITLIKVKTSECFLWHGRIRLQRNIQKQSCLCYCFCNTCENIDWFFTAISTFIFYDLGVCMSRSESELSEREEERVSEVVNVPSWS